MTRSPSSNWFLGRDHAGGASENGFEPRARRTHSSSRPNRVPGWWTSSVQDHRGSEQPGIFWEFEVLG
jgi:hypothetical protein